MKANIKVASTTGCVWGVLLGLAAPVLASDAQTSASATGGRGSSGNATATARYEGDVGFARTDTRSGRINLARGVAVGVDQEGISLSVSLAVAPSGSGPAFGTSFNLSIAADGSGSVSTGNALATGGTVRTVTVGGQASATPCGSKTLSMAAGRATPGGVVKAFTHSEHRERREIRVRRVVIGR